MDNNSHTEQVAAAELQIAAADNYVATQDMLASLGGNGVDSALPFPEVEVAPAAVTDIDSSQLISNHYSPGVTSGLEEKALNLLGSGISAENTASALGVTPSRISQLLAIDAFSAQVSELRFEALQSHNVRDTRYDSLEDRLITRLENSLPLMVKPADIVNALTRVNAAKRRGQSAPQQVVNQQNIVNLTIPTVIIDKFTINVNNQVVKAGEQELQTMPSGNLLKQVEDATAERIELIEDKSRVPELEG